jgi:hypothetical protein
MANGIDTSMERVQPTRDNTTADRAGADAKLRQLSSGDDAVLLGRDRSERLLPCLPVYAHTGSKDRQVGHG